MPRRWTQVPLIDGYLADVRQQVGGGAPQPPSRRTIRHIGSARTQVIDGQGNVRWGSDADDPASTAFCIFVADTTYDGQAFGAGDLLAGRYGGNHLHWDASAGTLGVQGTITVTGLGTVTPSAAGLYVSSDKIGYYDGTDWVAFFDSAGNAEFQGEIRATAGYIGGTSAGWAISSNTISSTGVTLKAGSTAYLGFGATPPTGPSTGTGLYVDQTGLYSLSSGTQQAYLNDTGLVVLPIATELYTGYASTVSVRFQNSADDYPIGYLHAYRDGVTPSNSYLLIGGQDPTGNALLSRSYVKLGVGIAEFWVTGIGAGKFKLTTAGVMVGTQFYPGVAGGGYQSSYYLEQVTGGLATNGTFDVNGALTGEAIAAKAYHNATQSVASAADATLSFNSERYDRASLHSTAANTSRMTIPRTGVYRLVANASFAASAAGTYRYIYFQVNGTINLALARFPFSGASTTFMTTVTEEYLTAGDYVEVRVGQDSGGALNINASTATTTRFGAEFAVSYIGD